MDRTGKAALDCVKELLPNLAASGLWDSLTPFAGALASAAGLSLGGLGLVPAGVGLACVAAYIGLHRVTEKSEKQEAADLTNALELLRRNPAHAEQELEDLGFQLTMNFENVHLRLTTLDRAVADVAELLAAGLDGLEARLTQLLRQNRDLVEDVWFGLWRRFEIVKDQLDRIEATACDTRDLLASHGFAPLVTSNVPPVPISFVQRPQPLRELTEALWAGDGASLVGRAQIAAGGGYGKTVLAYYYAARHRDDYPGGTYKVACEGADLAHGLTQLMPSHEGVKGLTVAERAQIIRAKLSSDRRALLILDNIAGTQQWEEFRNSGLLPTPPCHILVTTRASDIHDLRAIHVRALEEDEAVELLAQYRPSVRQAGPETVAVILRETERIAALVAAVGIAMAEDRSDDWPSYALWLASAKPAQLPDSGAWVAQYTDYPHKTVAILDDLRARLAPAALRALDYASLLPVDMIARGWLEKLLSTDADPVLGARALDLGKDVRAQSRDPAWHIQRLKERDLLRPANRDETLWSLHRLHRKRAQDHLAAEPEKKRSMLLVIADHARSRSGWLGHAERWVKHEHRWELLPLRALVHLDNALCFDHPDVAVIVNQVAYMLVRLGQPSEALPMFESALAMTRRLVPEDHPAVATGLNNLATCLQSLGRPNEALSSFEAALRIVERLEPGDNPDTVTSFSALAVCLQSLGRYADALSRLEAALDMAHRLFPGAHTIVAQSLNNLAHCLQCLGRIEEALQKYELALQMTCDLYSGDHPWVATSLNNVGACLQSLGRSGEALSKFEAALEMNQRLFPGDHPDVAQCLNSVAGCLQSLDRSVDALPSFERALQMRQRLYRGGHPEVAQSLNNVGACLQSLGRNAQALPQFEAALEMSQRCFKGDHPDVATSLNNVAFCLQCAGRLTEALPLFEDALEMFRRLLPPEHPHTLHAQIRLATGYIGIGRFGPAEALLQDAAEQCERSDASRGRHWKRVAERMVELYESWHALEPDKGYEARAQHWRARL